MEKIMFELITKGIYCSNDLNDKDLSQINKNLRVIDYTAKFWYDKSCIILFDQNADYHKTSNELTQINIKILNKIIKNERISYNENVQRLLDHGWIEKYGDEEQYYGLSKKFLIQYKSYILSLSNNEYNECSICKILVKNETEHDFCRKQK